MVYDIGPTFNRYYVIHAIFQLAYFIQTITIIFWEI